MLLSTRALPICLPRWRTLLVGGTVSLEYFGVLPHVPVVGFFPAPLYQNPIYVGGVLFFFVSTMFVITYLATGMTSRLRKREAEVIRLGQSLQRAYDRLQTLYEGAKASSSTLTCNKCSTAW